MSQPSLLWAYCLLIVGGRALLTLTPGMWGWGLNAQRFLDPFTGWGLWAVSALCVIPAVARPVSPLLTRAWTLAEHSRRALVAIGLAAALLVWLMPDRLWFVGDFMIRQGHAHSGLLSIQFESSMPLDLLLHSIAPSVVVPDGSTAGANAFVRVLGAAEAGGLALAAVAFARSLGVSGAAALTAVVVVFFTGCLTMFTGLGKAASELCLIAVLLVTCSVYVVRGRQGLWPASLAMSLALGFHRSAFLLLPTYVLVVFLYLRRIPHRSIAKWCPVLLPTIVAALLMPHVLGLLRTYDLGHHLSASRGWMSTRRVLDLTNIVLALAPMGLVLPASLLSARGVVLRSPETLVFLTNLACALPLLLFVSPQQGVFRDWDVFALPATALTLAASRFVAATLEREGSRPWVATTVVITLVVGSLQCLALNRNLGSGLERVRAYIAGPPGPAPGEEAMLWDFLASRNFGLGRWGEAAVAAERAARLAPRRRTLLAWALAETKQGNYAKARTAYEQLLVQRPNDPLGLIGLAGVAVRLGDAQTRSDAIAKLRAFGPDSREMWEIRRHLTMYPEVWPEQGP